MARKAEKGNKTKEKLGRKSLWTELDMDSRLEAVQGWAKNGSLDSEMWTALGVSEATFYKWKREIPKFAEALRKGKFDSNGEILNSAFRQSTGYYITVTEPIKLRDEYGAEHVEMVTYDKFIPANSTMSIFLMKNRLPEQYKDKQEIKHEGTMGVTIVDDIGTDDE